MLKKDAIRPMPDYFDRYINMTEDVMVIVALQISLQELEIAPIEKWKALGEKVYAPGKWTINEMLQHIIDTERIFVYRSLAFARNEQAKMHSFDENAYADRSFANRRSIDELVAEMKILRLSTIQLYQSYTESMLLQNGNGATGVYSPLAIGFVLAGHQKWHFKILEERYYSLLG